MRRVRGSGSIHQRFDGQWVAMLELPTPRGEKRKRRTLYGQTREVVEARLAKMQAELGIAPRIREEGDPNIIRARRLEAARLLGRHTPKEWYALLREHNNRCYYCGGTAWPHHLLTKDHKTPITRGGSDAIDNITPACKRCNSEKNDLTMEEFLRYESREERQQRREASAAKRRGFRLST